MNNISPRAILTVLVIVFLSTTAGCAGEAATEAPPAEAPVPTSTPGSAFREPLRSEGAARPGEESRVELEDGAAIVIPANAIAEEVTVVVERNPQKANNLPPFGGDVVPLGDFYNFEVTEGELLGPVDLILPFDAATIPDNSEGLLVAAFPTDGGWTFEPVTAEGDHVTLYTDEVGDPLIAWHFADAGDRVDLHYETHEEGVVCDTRIELQVTPQRGTTDMEFRVHGQLKPPNPADYSTASGLAVYTDFEPVANIPVEIELVTSQPDGNIPWDTVTTDEDGVFSFSIDGDSLPYGTNWVDAKAECDKWYGKIPVVSEGHAYFVLEQPEGQAAEEPEGEAVAEAEEPAAATIPKGAVQIPDVVGKTLEEAMETLESIGFGITWIDGSSTLGLGMIYQQEPAAGEYYVPHRTTVVLYRTTEQPPTSTPSSAPEPTNTPKPSGEAVVRADATNATLHREPSMDAPVGGKLSPGTAVDIREKNPDETWVRIRLEDGNYWWIWAGFLDIFIDLGDIPVSERIQSATVAVHTDAFGDHKILQFTCEQLASVTWENYDASLKRQYVMITWREKGSGQYFAGLAYFNVDEGKKACPGLFK